jgi:hypothetical protein
MIHLKKRLCDYFLVKFYLYNKVNIKVTKEIDYKYKSFINACKTKFLFLYF